MYEYVCLKCKTRFELLRSLSERDEPAECPECGTKKKHVRAPSLFSGLGGSETSSSGGCSTGTGFG
jgi:putative FmdB family regulatory protein